LRGRSAGPGSFLDDVSVLFQPERHEPLTETSWNDEWARDAIRGVIEDADANFDPDGLWPVELRIR
jgi:hypothetical protein